ncbi:MAG: hypothetical protein PHY77_05895 [Desulfotomaculaceae bacterium]|nr:hypothetical protein [Desulfotomaculaceae bacterium]
MIQIKYLNRYSQAAGKTPSPRRPAQEALENKNACSEKSTPEEPVRDQPDALLEQSNSMAEEAVKAHAGNNVIDGYKEIAPGIYQFLQLTHGGKGYNAPPQITNAQKACEPKFQRVDGLPGPYQHYNTPVFQFT